MENNLFRFLWSQCSAHFMLKVYKPRIQVRKIFLIYGALCIFIWQQTSMRRQTSKQNSWFFVRPFFISLIKSSNWILRTVRRSYDQVRWVNIVFVVLFFRDRKLLLFWVVLFLSALVSVQWYNFDVQEKNFLPG